MRARQASTAILLLVMSIGPAHAFDNYEHRKIGERAFRSAIALLDEERSGTSRALFGQSHLSRKWNSIGAVAGGHGRGREVGRFSFGDLVAIYGDHAENFEEVNHDRFEDRSSRLIKIVRTGKFGRATDEQERFLALAVNNPTHFSRRAVEAYAKWHTKALGLAAEKNKLWEALHYEALALHSFTDLFAFGHMHDNRELTDRITQWSKEDESDIGFVKGRVLKEIKALFAETAGKALGAEVNFYHSAFNWKGALLKNFAGESWWGYGDGRYRVVGEDCRDTRISERRADGDPDVEPQCVVIIRATRVSILEVLDVAAGVAAPREGHFPALCHIPVSYSGARFPVDPVDQPLEIVRLAIEMRWDGERIEETGFDFSRKILRFKKRRSSGEVKYKKLVRRLCRGN